LGWGARPDCWGPRRKNNVLKKKKIKAGKKGDSNNKKEHWPWSRSPHPFGGKSSFNVSSIWGKKPAEVGGEEGGNKVGDPFLPCGGPDELEEEKKSKEMKSGETTGGGGERGGIESPLCSWPGGGHLVKNFLDYRGKKNYRKKTFLGSWSKEGGTEFRVKSKTGKKYYAVVKRGGEGEQKRKGGEEKLRIFFQAMFH